MSDCSRRAGASHFPAANARERGLAKLSIKQAVRATVNRNALLRSWFVTFCARYSSRLFALQSYLSLQDLRSKFRARLWNKVLALLEKRDLEKVVFSQGKSIFYYEDGCAYFVETRKQSVSASLFTTGSYEINETNFVSKIVKPGWVIIDAGANFGWYAVRFARLVQPDGKVHAFEPVPETHRELVANVNLNRCANLAAYNIALGSIQGTVSMFVPNIRFGAGAASQFLDGGKKLVVPMLKLDDFLGQHQIAHIDFIKADIEGGELNLLRGAEEILAKCRPNILLEISDIHCARFGHTPQDVIQFLERRGYNGKYMNEEGNLEDFQMAHPPNGNYFFENKCDTLN